MACLYVSIFFHPSGLGFVDNALIINQNIEAFPIEDASADSQYLNGIQAGCGYSSDLRQVSQLQCYNTEIVDHDCTKTLNGGEVLSFTQLLNTLKIHNSKKTDLLQMQRMGFWFFFRGEELPYLKSIEDSESSLSLNVAYVLKNKVKLVVKGYGVYALNTIGRNAYKNGNNPKFGLVCGDYYFSSFTEGAMLLVALDIHFNSRNEKEKFNEYRSSASFFNFHSSSQDIQRIANTYNVKGYVVLKAYQLGGNPERLANIFKDPKGYYYLATCDMSNIQSCVDTAHQVLDYVANDFSKQVGCDPPKGLYPLGTDFEYRPISMIGLAMPPSPISAEALQFQDELTCQLDKYNKCLEDITEIIEYYPSSWDKSNGFYQNLQTLAEKIKNNFALLQYDTQTCINEPYKCGDIEDNIALKAALITPEDLKDLPTIKDYNTYSSLSHFLNDRGLLAHNACNYNKAISYYTEALKLKDVWINNNRAAVFNNRGDSYSSLGYQYQADEDYNKAL